MNVLLIPAALSEPVQVLDLPENPPLERLYELIGCEVIEACYPLNAWAGLLAAYVDEEGMLNDKVPNVRLMRLFGNTNEGMGLRGNALVFGDTPYDGHMHAIPPGLVRGYA